MISRDGGTTLGSVVDDGCGGDDRCRMWIGRRPAELDFS
jgi:hypothetical protein